MKIDYVLVAFFLIWFLLLFVNVNRSIHMQKSTTRMRKRDRNGIRYLIDKDAHTIEHETCEKTSATMSRNKKASSRYLWLCGEKNLNNGCLLSSNRIDFLSLLNWNTKQSERFFKSTVTIFFTKRKKSRVKILRIAKKSNDLFKLNNIFSCETKVRTPLCLVQYFFCCCWICVIDFGVIRMCKFFFLLRQMPFFDKNANGVATCELCSFFFHLIF